MMPWFSTRRRVVGKHYKFVSCYYERIQQTSLWRVLWVSVIVGVFGWICQSTPLPFLYWNRARIFTMPNIRGNCKQQFFLIVVVWLFMPAAEKMQLQCVKYPRYFQLHTNTFVLNLKQEFSKHSRKKLHHWFTREKNSHPSCSMYSKNFAHKHRACKTQKNWSMGICRCHDQCQNTEKLIHGGMLVP